MVILEEVYFEHEKQKNEENVKNIKRIIKLLLETDFKGRLGLLRNIVITNNLERTIKEHGYVNIRKTAQGATHAIGSGYDIIINYNNLGLEDERTGV